MMQLCNMKMLVLGFAMMATITLLASTPTITSVTAQQRYPWNGKVDISYTATGDVVVEAKQKALLTSFKVTATDKTANVTYTATKLSGDMALTAGTHKLVWDMDAEGLSFISSNVVFSVSCETTPATYCVIDLSAGANASSYPVTYLTSPPSGGFNVDTFKTTKLVLRRIEPGEFQMCGSYSVTLTKPYFVGIFEMTQKQYSLVMGTNPSEYKGDKRPVECVSYNMIRGSTNGAMWPTSSAVDPSSFMGKLSARTELDFDLPTEAQWEYACRAGTTSAYNNGGSSEDDLKKLGRYVRNQSDGQGGYSSNHTTVGSYTPNAWGLYDMHGNVWEWCLDWYTSSLSSGMTDPKGPSSGTYRLLRSGSWSSVASTCTSFVRNSDTTPLNETSLKGFRLVRTLPDDNDLSCVGKSMSVPIDLTSGMRTATLTERISYSSTWAETADEDSRAIVEVNGETLVSTVDSGYVDWIPPHNGRYTFTHKIMSGTTQIGETLEASFFVDHFVLDPLVMEPKGATFENTSQTVLLSCATDESTILYTKDGSDPKVNGFEYAKPFNIYESCTVRAIVIKHGWKDSEEVAATFTRAEPLSEAVNLYGYLMETDTSNPWTVGTDVSHDGVSCARSGVIDHSGMTWLQTSMRKAGTVSFWWKAACEEAEEEDDETYWYDYGVFLVDGVEKAKIAGNDTGWRKVEVEVPSGGKHILRWEYRKDGATSYSPDCIWLDQVQWIPTDDSGYTLTTPEPVPYSWLRGYNLGLDSDFETAAKSLNGKNTGGKAMSVWQDYVAGTDPTNVNSVFTAAIEMVDGLPHVTWSPNLNTNGEVRVYTIFGKTNLADATWVCPTNAAHRFFKVKVEMP